MVVALDVTLTGKSGVVMPRAEGRVRKKARVWRLSFIVTMLKVVGLRKVVVKNFEDCLWAEGNVRKLCE